jgi:protein-S-isoprenylcysteine O-methyltransferase Ste14
MENILEYSLLVYILCNISLTFVLPSYRVWKKTGIFPITFGKEDTAHNYVGKVFKILMALLVFTGIVYSFYKEGVSYLIPIWYLEKPFLQIIGLILLFIALIWIIVAQFHMANSWRIGIDEKNKTALVTEGVFSISRNPIFLGMLTTLLGLFLIIPNIITLLVLVTGFVTVQIQVRLEENFLAKSHQMDYEEYCKKTRRWL